MKTEAKAISLEKIEQGIMNVPFLVSGRQKRMFLDAVASSGAERVSQHSAGEMSGKGRPPRSRYASFTSFRSAQTPPPWRAAPCPHLPG